jgi:phenylacetate-coenzyme A ligase PaaK-like adenylate-forming protein
VTLPDIQELLAFLRAADPEELELMGEAAVLDSFRNAAAEVPAYRDLLARHGLDPVKIVDIESFKREVPLTDRETTFLAYPLHELCRGGKISGIKSVVPTSGHSGTFAFSLDTAEGAALAAKGADLAFEYVLGISKRPGFVVNCYPMGLQVPTSMAVANTGVSTDVALAVIKAMAPYFEQLVIVGQPLFVKKLLEDGLDRGMDWSRLRPNVVTGGEGFAESWRTYMSRLVGIADPDNPTTHFVVSTMGTGELGLNLFHEIPETIRIIRGAYRDPGLRQALFGDGVTHTPHLYVYYPMRSFVEEVPLPGWPGGDLAVSHTALDLPLPLLRYRTGDVVRLIPYRRLEEILGERASALRLPGLKLPCAAVFGRRDALEIAGIRLTVEMIKEALFLDERVAQSVTGFFRIDPETHGIRLDIQLREGSLFNSELEERLWVALRISLPPAIVCTPRLFPYPDYPQVTTHERKHQYLVV